MSWFVNKTTTEWADTKRHVLTVGTATCVVSNLLLQASEFEPGSAQRAILTYAAKDVLHHRKLARRSRSMLTAQKPRKIQK